jgi:signal transduction histidine kinase
MSNSKSSVEVKATENDSYLSDGFRVSSAPGEEQIKFIQKRVHEKMDDYREYSFSATEKRVLMIFFDLAQEFDSLEEFFCVSTMVPKLLFNIDSRMYLAQSKDEYQPVSSTENDSPVCIRVPLEMECTGGHLFVPIRGNHEIIDQLPFKPEGDIIGCFEVYPVDDLSEHQMFFFEKYVNRVGFQLHSKLLRRKGQEHLEFVRNLVKDVGHNVIVPNMYFKLFYNRLRDKIENIKKLGEKVQDIEPDVLKKDLDEMYTSLVEQFNEIHSHYEQTSLFLETLLRRRHFEEGRYIVEKRPCNLFKQIIAPQVERYRSRLQERGIRIDLSMGGVPDKEIRIVADVGLLSQVYANLFSNAVKYTREAYFNDGSIDKFVAYGWQYLESCFSDGKCGLKMNVFTTGPHLSADDRGRLFKAGFRGDNSSMEYGSGHGLFFVRQVVELHGGIIGYEAQEGGNNFYFILPYDLGSIV